MLQTDGNVSHHEPLEIIAEMVEAFGLRGNIVVKTPGTKPVALLEYDDPQSLSPHDLFQDNTGPASQMQEGKDAATTFRLADPRQETVPPCASAPDLACAL